MKYLTKNVKVAESIKKINNPDAKRRGITIFGRTALFFFSYSFCKIIIKRLSVILYNGN